MPANLTPDYKAAEERYKRAKDDEERLACLVEMLSLIPKHKGTEKLQADIKTRISKLKKQHAAKPGAKRSTWYQIDRQGAGQVVLFGPPNSGKSSIVAALTGAQTTVAAYPFSTVAPQAGMMPFEDIQIQLIDTPPIYQDTEPWVYHFLRVADLLVMVLDLGDDDIILSLEKTLTLLTARNILFRPEDGGSAPGSRREERAQGEPARLLRSAEGGALAQSAKGETPVRPVIVVGCKADADGAVERRAIASEILGSDLPILPLTTTTHTGLEDMRLTIFQRLHVVRIYTKRPGHPPDMDEPVILPEGSTVLDAAQHLHKDFAAQLKYARYWDNDKFNGQMVERAHVVKDRAVVEFHT
jgi:hypothetical protein